jgi:hypothetical protein
MKPILLLFSLFLLFNVGYCQKDSVLTKDSISKIKKLERKKANDFIIKTFGKEAFDNYFNIERVGFYKTPNPQELEQYKNCKEVWPFLCSYDFNHQSFFKKYDRKFINTSLSNYDYVIFSYNLTIRGFSTDELSRIYLVHDILNDSFYFYQPERIPPFIMNKNTNNFITNELLLKIIQGYYSRLSTWKKVDEKTDITLRYSSKCNIYVFEIKKVLKKGRKGLIKKYRNIIVDAYNGDIVDDYITDGISFGDSGCAIF